MPPIYVKVNRENVFRFISQVKSVPIGDLELTTRVSDHDLIRLGSYLGATFGQRVTLSQPSKTIGEIFQLLGI